MRIANYGLRVQGSGSRDPNWVMAAYAFGVKGFAIEQEVICIRGFRILEFLDANVCNALFDLGEKGFYTPGSVPLG